MKPKKERISRGKAEEKLDTLIGRLNSSAKEHGIDYSKRPYAQEVEKYIRKVLKKELRTHYIISDC